MNAEKPLFVHWNDCPLLAPFSHYLMEVGVLKFSGIDPHSLDMHYNDGIELNFVVKGTYKWVVEGKHYQLYPGEAFVTCPWEYHGSPDKILDRGVLSWMILHPKSFTKDGQLELGSWSRISPETQQAIGRLLVNNENPVLPRGNNLIQIFRQFHFELVQRDIGYEDQINFLLDSLVIRLARVLKARNNNQEDTDRTFLNALTEMLCKDFTRKIRVSELAYIFGMGQTAFNNKVKLLTGFSPADYLIELKIKAAQELLASGHHNITDIAIECGFYSSQHFASLFAKRVGCSPSQYRNKLQELNHSSTSQARHKIKSKGK